MRARAVGGFEPDEKEQHELSELWHTSRTAIAVGGDARRVAILKHGNEHYWRMHWCIDEFMKAHAGEPNVAHKWVYNWCVEYLGRHVDPNPVPYGPDVFDGTPNTERRDLDRDERLFAEANDLLDSPIEAIRRAFFYATPGTPAHKRYVTYRNAQRKVK